MDNIKFRYVFQHGEMGLFIFQYFTLEQIEGNDFNQQCLEKFGSQWCPPIRKDLYIGRIDITNKEIYNNDIIKTILDYGFGEKEIIGVVEYDNYNGIWMLDFPEYGITKPLNEFVDVGLEKIGDFYNDEKLLWLHRTNYMNEE